MKVVFAGVHFCQKSWVNFWPWKSDLVDIWNISFAHPTYFRLHQKTYITADGKRRLVSNYLNVYRKGWPITVEMSVIDKHCVKCPCSEFFWSLFSHILTEYGNLSRMRENADQKNCEYRHILRIGTTESCFQHWSKHTNTHKFSSYVPFLRNIFHTQTATLNVKLTLIFKIHTPTLLTSVVSILKLSMIFYTL